MTVGMRIREARHDAGLTLEALAGRSGFAVRTICAWEAGARHPRPGNLASLAQIFNRDVAWFYTPEGGGTSSVPSGSKAAA